MARRKWTKEEIEDYRKIHAPFFYFNKEDSNFIVPKAHGIGFSFNWANPISWIIALVIAGYLVYRMYILKAWQ